MGDAGLGWGERVEIPLPVPAVGILGAWLIDAVGGWGWGVLLVARGG